MRRTVVAIALGYGIIGLAGRGMEALGLRSCGCDPDCWCRRPGLSLFRWALPRWHKDRAIAVWKAARETSS